MCNKVKISFCPAKLRGGGSATVAKVGFVVLQNTTAEVALRRKQQLALKENHI